MKKQTAAEKFDLVPPWCEIKDAPGGHGFWVHHIEREFVCINTTGEWATNDARRYTTQENAIAAARLTSPLDSWEPKDTDPLPVEGWSLKTNADNSEWFVYTGPATGYTRFPTRRAAIVWAWRDAPAPTVKEDLTVAPACKESLQVAGRIPPDELGKLTTRIGKAEVQIDNILARIGPVTDGKGRTLADLDREADQLTADFRAFRSTIAHDILSLKKWSADDRNRLDNLERLIAARVPAITPGRNDAAAHNALATDVAGVDWRRMLAPYRCTPASRDIAWVSPVGNWMTVSYSDPNTGWWCIGGSIDCWEKVENEIPANALAFRDSIKTPPPNLAEWWKPGGVRVDIRGCTCAKDILAALEAAGIPRPYAPGSQTTATFDVLVDRESVIEQARTAIPPTYRCGDDLAAWVRNLAAAHEQALKYQRELERKLGDANTAAVAADGRAATAVKRATEAESKLADARASLEQVQLELAETNRMLTNALESAETPD